MYSVGEPKQASPGFGGFGFCAMAPYGCTGLRSELS